MKPDDVRYKFVKLIRCISYSNTLVDNFPQYGRFRLEADTILFIKEVSKNFYEEQDVFICVDADMNDVFTSFFFYSNLTKYFEIIE